MPRLYSNTFLLQFKTCHKNLTAETAVHLLPYHLQPLSCRITVELLFKDMIQKNN